MIGSNTSSALVASAAQRKIRRDKVEGTVGEGWQARLWEIYEQLGPVHYGVSFKRNSAEKIDYFIAEAAHDDEPARSDDPKANEALARLGDITSIVSEFVAQENVAGEGYLVGQERDGVETWDVWSTLEVKAAQQAMKRHPESVEPLREDDFLLRVWRPSPKNHAEPDSPLRSVQQQCEQLLLLNEQIGAVAMSRLSAGLLLVPSELSFARSPEENPDTGANIEGDPFMDEIIQIMVNPISDSESAARVAPAVVRGPKDYLKEMRQLTFGREIDKTFAEMREELLRQIAAGLDLPPEIILGKADLNHWSAWDVDESAAKLHVDPDVLHILDGLTRGYLWPTLTGENDQGTAMMSMEEAQKFIIWRDYSDLTSRPMSLSEAHNLAKDNIITGNEVRAVANLPRDEEGELSAADIASRAEAVGVYYRAGFEPEAVLSALGLPAIPHTGVAPVTIQSEADVDDVPDEPPAGPDNVDRGPPGLVASVQPLTALADIDAMLTAKIIEAAEAAAHRALERAGAKVRAKAKKDRELSALIEAVANDKVTLTLGERRIERLQLTADQLVPTDTFDPLAARLEGLVESAQDETRGQLSLLFGTEVEESAEEEEDRRRGIFNFIAALIGLVAARLFTSDPDLDPAETGEIGDSIASGEIVFQLLTTAGGTPPAAFAPDSPRGLALGQRTRALLIDHGFLIETETWRYGLQTRRTNFDPHRALDGFKTDNKEDPRLRSSTAWLGVTHYFPGDHRGCLCRWVPSVELVE
jgi:hypothetical protein